MTVNIKYPVIALLVLALLACASHEEKVKDKHDEGKEQTEEKAAVVKGAGEGLKSLGKDAMESLSEGIGEVIKGAKSGFDKSLTKVNLKADTSVSVYGIATGKSGKYYNDSLKTNAVSVYMLFNEDINIDLLLVATDHENMEVGRVKQKVNEKEGTSRYVDFVFDKRMNIDLVKEFKLSVYHKKKK